MAEEFDFSHLSPEEFHVLREAGTERAWSGEYNKHYSKGNYNCRGCGNQLFESDTKFDSGSGWPSFDQAIDGSVIELEDRSYGMLRVEVQCSRCKSHLGHVFPDGPRETTGQRYCMNSLSLTLINISWTFVHASPDNLISASLFLMSPTSSWRGRSGRSSHSINVKMYFLTRPFISPRSAHFS